MNQTFLRPQEVEIALSEKLAELLNSMPLGTWEVTRNPAAFDRAWDLLAVRHHPGRPDLELWVDCRAEPRPSQFPYVNLQREFREHHLSRVRASVFAAPFISPGMATICEEHGWGWFDLAGNCRISIPEILHVERKGNEPVCSRPRPLANLSTPEAGRIMRALLSPSLAGNRWTHQSLLKECEPAVSIGLINKVVRHLRDEALLHEETERGFKVKDPVKLLFAWRDVYRFDRNKRTGYFTLKQGPALREALAGLELMPPGHAAYAAFSAADFQSPHVRQPKTWVYVSVGFEREFARQTESKPVESGENVVVLTPPDDGVFYNPEVDGTIGQNRLSATSPVQTYVDLFHCGNRGREAAESLLERKLKPEWKLRGGL